MNFLDAFWPSFWSAIAAGFSLTLLFFLIREKVYGKTDISGKWHFNMTTEKTAYNPYKNMELRYIAILWLEGNEIHGTVEKVHEFSSTTNEAGRSYVGENRSRGVVTGVYEKKYFGKDKIHIHISEQGKGRESTNFFTLRFSKCINFRVEEIKLSGTFSSFVADQEGSSSWQRKCF
ncbi:hypothetical protein D5R81_07690 [Parashewanella spongiae]|uniref:SMODS-associating 2TM beta-strand rich effector domain-containing protein n=1 Tax=Parashewanella spongiae TaxID=342950 RepID=A0A3A6UFP1_9GAMM|nr:hypothetical protein [Parashewanella spongiae]MCL1077106.1 hypothetical protein [Parashewanella spongiae]RJY17661.1 hypothetical protein D5R81_07690 [Parashewanella spongiae]